MPSCAQRLRVWRASAGGSAIGACMILLRREGFVVNHKRLFRLYREERLMVRRRGGRKRALGHAGADAGARSGRTSAGRSTSSPISFIDGRRFRILAIVDDCTRECLALVADTSLSGSRVARELDRLIAARGKPKTIVSDNGTELTCNADPALGDRQPGRLALHRTRASRCRTPSSRASTAACATSSSTRRCSPRLPRRAADLDDWRRDYNTVRPHSRIGWLTPAAYAEQF